MTTTTTEPTRHRRRNIFGISLLVLLGLLTAVWLIDRSAPTTTREQTFTLEGTERLTVDLGSGDVSLLRSPDNRIQVWRTVASGWREPTFEERSDPGGAVISADCPTFLSGGCHIAYRIAVPDGIAVDVAASSGDIRMQDVHLTDAHIAVSSGRIELTDVAADALEVRASSGWITATGLDTPTATANLSSGSMSLAFAAPPDTVQASSSSGSLTIYLPTNDVKYRVDADVTSGTRRVEVPTDSASPHAITVTASSGNASVLPR